MNAVIRERIVDIVSGMDPKVFIHPSAVAYLHLLVKPYADAIETATIAQLQVWIHSVLKGDLINIVTNALDEYFKGITILHHGEGLPTISMAYARNTVIDTLLSEIIKDASVEVVEDGSDTIWPWDIQAILSANDAYKFMFEVASEAQTLPVDFINDGKRFTHEVSMDFVAGLVVAMSAIGKQVTDTVSIFGEPFKIGDILPRSRYTVKAGKFYTVTINGVFYSFDGAEFMQGFATAAQWAGVDHRNYWTNLIHHIYTTAGDRDVEVTF